MTDNNKHLVRVGHEFAAAMSDDTPIITIAKMVTELASALDVQSARSDALAAKLNDVCAENAAIKREARWGVIKIYTVFSGDDSVCQGTREKVVPLSVQTPNTDAWVNEQRATGVDGAIEKLITMLNHQSTGVSASINVLRTFAAQLRGGQV